MPTSMPEPGDTRYFQGRTVICNYIDTYERVGFYPEAKTGEIVQQEHLPIDKWNALPADQGEYNHALENALLELVEAISTVQQSIQDLDSRLARLEKPELG